MRQYATFIQALILANFNFTLIFSNSVLFLTNILLPDAFYALILSKIYFIISLFVNVNK